jgi:hypothetical protein
MSLGSEIFAVVWLRISVWWNAALWHQVIDLNISKECSSFLFKGEYFLEEQLVLAPTVIGVMHCLC